MQVIFRLSRLIKWLRRATEQFDGGYVFAGILGNGDSFVIRDPNGIRPCWYARTEDLIAVASERVALMTIVGVSQEDVHELPAGHALIMKADGRHSVEAFHAPGEIRHCSFERIYFSRGNDPEIYAERKALGAALADDVLAQIRDDHDNAVFSYIPNTAEIAWYGLMEELRKRRRAQVSDKLIAAQRAGQLDEALIDIALDLSGRPFVVWDVPLPECLPLGDPAFDPQLAEHAISSLAMSAGVTLHVELKHGRNVHHIIEAAFKGLGRCFRDAVRIELYDQEVEQISWFDPLTGAVESKVPRVTIFPKSHYVTPRDVMLDAVVHIEAELADRLKQLRENEASATMSQPTNRLRARSRSSRVSTPAGTDSAASEILIVCPLSNARSCSNDSKVSVTDGGHWVNACKNPQR